MCAAANKMLSVRHINRFLNTTFKTIIALCILTLIGNIIAPTHANEIKAFADFLAANQLKHGIVVQSFTHANETTHLHQNSVRENLISHYRILFYNMAKCNSGGQKQFHDYFYASSPRVGILVSLGESVSEGQHGRLFDDASAGDYFNQTQAWFIVLQKNVENLGYIRSIFEPYNININADITVGVKQKNNSLLLYDLFKVCHQCNTPLEIEEKGWWSAETGYLLKSKFRASFVARRLDFRGITVKAGTAVLEKPANLENVQYLANLDNMQLDSMQRKTYHLLKLMEPMYNVSYDVIFAKAWGSVQTNGSWNGVMQQILTHEVEFAMCPMRFTLERAKAIHFPPELHTEYILFLFRHPRRNVIRNIFFEPFTTLVWWSIFGLIIITIAQLFLHVLYERKQNERSQKLQRHSTQQQQQQQQQSENANTPKLESRFDFIVLTILEAIFMQGPSPDIFNCASTRTLIVTTCLFSVMLLQFYSAFIVGSLLAEAPRTITTLPALYNSSLDIGMENIAYNYEIFNTTKEIVHDIYTKRICRNVRRNIITLEQGVKRIGGGGFAFHVSADRAYRILKYQLTEDEFCDLQEVAVNPPYTASIAMRKSSIYREYFTRSILHFRETGLLGYNDKLWEVKKTDCSLNQNTEVEVDLEHFVPALMFLATAMLISIATLILELIVDKWLRVKAAATHHKS